MLLLFCTKVLRPQGGRIGSVTKRFVLSRAILVRHAIGGTAGAVLGLVVGSRFPSFVLTFLMMIGGIALGVWVVDLRPWKGENIARVAAVRFGAFRRKVRTICPGSAMPVTTDRTGVEFCADCGLVCDIITVTGMRVSAQHEWKRAMYVGIQPIRPFVGAVRYTPGSVEVTPADEQAG